MITDIKGDNMDNLIDEKDVIYEPEDTISTFDAGNDVLTLLKDATILGLDEEGNEIPGYVFAESISEILGMPIETLVDFAKQNGYTIFTAHVNGEELPANLYVICAKGCDIQTIKDDYKEIYELDIELRPTEEPKEQERVELAIDEAKGLYANIHAKRKRIKAGSGERMRKPGSKGAPTKKDFKDASKTVKEERISKGMSVEDIAEKHGVSIRAIEMQIEKGIKVEKEHTDNETEARRIAMDHLVEIADYYTRLNKMEKDAKIKEAKQNELEKRAKQHKKKDKKGARGWFVNPNAGNVEHNIKFFNKALGNKATEPTTTADGSVGGMLSTNTQGTSGSSDGGGMGESLDFVKNEDETKEEFVSRFITERKEQYESVRKCYEDALSHWEKNQ
jgi:transcriptional regulator with XRE-family HTH domain